MIRARLTRNHGYRKPNSQSHSKWLKLLGTGLNIKLIPKIVWQIYTKVGISPVRNACIDIVQTKNQEWLGLYNTIDLNQIIYMPRHRNRYIKFRSHNRQITYSFKAHHFKSNNYKNWGDAHISKTWAFPLHSYLINPSTGEHLGRLFIALCLFYRLPLLT